jgi:hypothetical protein
MKRTIPELARLMTIAVAVPVSMVLWYLDNHYSALVFLITAIWSILSFWVLEGLIKSALLAPGKKRNIKAILLLASAKIALYAVALWAIFAAKLPPYACIAGFSLLMMSIVVSGIISGQNLQSLNVAGQDDDD